MDLPPPSYTTNPTLSRAAMSRDEVSSLADSLLQSSLASHTSTWSASTKHGSIASHESRLADELSAGRGSSISVPYSTSSTTSTSQLKNLQAGKVSEADAYSRRVSLAEGKRRVRQLQSQVTQASASMGYRKTTGIFKETCSTDLLFLIDTTSSMFKYIDAAKKQVISIVTDIKQAFLHEAEVRIAVVGYKDHKDRPHIQFQDFTHDAKSVATFLTTLKSVGGRDLPEDVLGGLQQALKASWQQQTRCLIHIVDAPAHGTILHDLGEKADDYPKHGSEPHKLTYEPIVRGLTDLNINYALLRINASTDKMCEAFATVYATMGAETHLFRDNRYFSQHVSDFKSRELSQASTARTAELQFEEMELGINYDRLRSLVTTAVTSSASRTASRLASISSRSAAKSSGLVDSAETIRSASDMTRTAVAPLMTAIREDDGDPDEAAGTREAVMLDRTRARWDSPAWLNQRFSAEGFCPDIGVQHASTLINMMERDENIRLSFAELNILARSQPFAEGAQRLANYAKTSHSTDKFVVKRFKKASKGMAHLAEEMRCQALCKAFALEFNSILKLQGKDAVDFIATTCLETTPGNECISLEPYIDGKYVKFNSNDNFVLKSDDSFNQTAQAFSHFTFERSWGNFLVNDLQGVGNMLTDPAIQTRDPERFKLIDTNLNSDGFKFFFSAHACNDTCRKLELLSTREMIICQSFSFRERWPAMDTTVCCSNRLCRRIINLDTANKSTLFPGKHWCDSCFPQLASSTMSYVCVEPGPIHEFDVSRFYHGSQGQAVPRKCKAHIEKDASESSAAVLGGGLWKRMKGANSKKTVSGRS